MERTLKYCPWIWSPENYLQAFVWLCWIKPHCPHWRDRNWFWNWLTSIIRVIFTLNQCRANNERGRRPFLRCVCLCLYTCVHPRGQCEDNPSWLSPLFITVKPAWTLPPFPPALALVAGHRQDYWTPCSLYLPLHHMRRHSVQHNVTPNGSIPRAIWCSGAIKWGPSERSKWCHYFICTYFFPALFV